MYLQLGFFLYVHGEYYRISSTREPVTNALYEDILHYESEYTMASYHFYLPFNKDNSLQETK